MPFLIIVSLSDIFFAGYPIGLTHGMTSPGSTARARSNAFLFIVPAIHVVPTPIDSAKITIFSKEYPNASSACGTRRIFPAK